MIFVAASNKDIASVNIRRQILEHYDFVKTSESLQGNPIYTAEIEGKNVKLITLNDELVHAQNVANKFSDAELVVFVSRHSNESGTPTLSVHTPGNLGAADLGGVPRSVSVSPANAMRNALKTLAKIKKEKQLAYEVSYEGTHHGPCLDVPAMFTELGSSMKQWEDMDAAEAVAHATMKAVSNLGDFSARTVLGIGGPHYNGKFTSMALENGVAFGHMIPKYAVPTIDSEILKQCIEKTLENVESIILDWKGIKGEDKPRLLKSIKDVNVPCEKM